MRGSETFQKTMKKWKTSHAGCDLLEEAYFKFFNGDREFCLNVKPESISSVLLQCENWKTLNVQHQFQLV